MTYTPADGLDDLVKEVTRLFGDAEAALIRRMAVSIAEGIDTDQWASHQYALIVRFRAEAAALLAKMQQQAATAGRDAILGAAARGGAHGAAEVAALLKVPMSKVGPGPAPMDTEAVVALARDLTGKLGNTGTPILRSVDDVYRRVIADVTARALLGAQTRREVAQEALDEFARRGITGYWDRKGRRWEIEAYTEMATRSSLMNAAIEGHAARLEANGFDLVVISDVPQECKLCRPWEGKVLSLSGGIDAAVGVTVAGTLDEARADGLFHPGCRHSYTAWHRNVRSFGETADPEGAAARQKLRYLERQVRAAKRQKLAALDNDAARKAQQRVAAYQAKIREHVANTSAKRQPAREQLGAR